MAETDNFRLTPGMSPKVRAVLDTHPHLPRFVPRGGRIRLEEDVQGRVCVIPEVLTETTAAGRKTIMRLVGEWQEAVRETLGPQPGTKEWMLESLLQWHRAGEGSYAEIGRQILKRLEPYVRQAAEAILEQAQTALQAAPAEDEQAVITCLIEKLAQDVASGVESGDHAGPVMALLGIRNLLVDLFGVSEDEVVHHLRDALSRAFRGEPDLFGPSRLILDQQRVRNALRTYESRKSRLRYPQRDSLSRRRRSGGKREDRQEPGCT